jgi:hypothetical protein
MGRVPWSVAIKRSLRPEKGSPREGHVKRRLHQGTAGRMASDVEPVSKGISKPGQRARDEIRLSKLISGKYQASKRRRLPRRKEKIHASRWEHYRWTHVSWR